MIRGVNIYPYLSLGKGFLIFPSSSIRDNYRGGGKIEPRVQLKRWAQGRFKTVGYLWIWLVNLKLQQELQGCQCISISLYLSCKGGSSLLIWLYYQLMQGLQNTETKGADGLRGSFHFQIWHGWLNLTVTAKVAANRVGRSIWRYIYLFI